MRIWTVAWLLVMAVFATFAFVNWNVLAAPTPIDLILLRLTAPLGFVMLGAILCLALLFFLFLVWLETRTLLQIGRSGRQATGTSDGVNTQLLVGLEQQLTGLRTETSESMRHVLDRMEHLERIVKDDIESTSHVLGARVDKIESHIKRAS